MERVATLAALVLTQFSTPKHLREAVEAVEIPQLETVWQAGQAAVAVRMEPPETEAQETHQPSRHPKVITAEMRRVEL